MSELSDVLRKALQPAMTDAGAIFTARVTTLRQCIDLGMSLAESAAHMSVSVHDMTSAAHVLGAEFQTRPPASQSRHIPPRETVFCGDDP